MEGGHDLTQLKHYFTVMWFVPVNICASGVAIVKEAIGSMDQDEGDEMEVECEAEAEADKEAGTQGEMLALLSTVTHSGH